MWIRHVFGSILELQFLLSGLLAHTHRSCRTLPAMFGDNPADTHAYLHEAYRKTHKETLLVSFPFAPYIQQPRESKPHPVSRDSGMISSLLFYRLALAFLFSDRIYLRMIFTQFGECGAICRRHSIACCSIVFSIFDIESPVQNIFHYFIMGRLDTIF